MYKEVFLVVLEIFIIEFVVMMKVGKLKMYFVVSDGKLVGVIMWCDVL